jgi:PBP1b-binding outer membrane lipoprotein LpoB
MKKSLALILLFVVLLAGCRSRVLRDERMTLDAGKAQKVTIDPVSKIQTVSVSATATTGQVDVYLFLEKDLADIEKEISRNKVSPKVLDHKLKVTQADLKADIPANERGVVYVVSSEGQKAEAKLKITN